MGFKRVDNRRTRVLTSYELTKLINAAKKTHLLRVVKRRKQKQVEIYVHGELIFRAVSNGDAFWPCEYRPVTGVLKLIKEATA